MGHLTWRRESAESVITAYLVLALDLADHQKLSTMLDEARCLAAITDAFGQGAIAALTPTGYRM
jgi:hypothetical protein